LKLTRNNNNNQWKTAYHGYWPNDLYTINSHFGTPSDLKALSSALHARGMVSPCGPMLNTPLTEYDVYAHST
jgi:hypothetical protein